MKNKSGKNTLLWSIITSAPGPIVVGIGLIAGKSSTQLADFIRRSIELLAIICSFVIFSLTTKEGETDENKKYRLESAADLFVSIAEILSGSIMIILALTYPSQETGNVIFGLIIAILGVTANTYFWQKYKILAKNIENSILKTQSDLYRAKTFVDLSVTISLIVVMFSSSNAVRYYFDLIGTICVSLYLIFTGVTSLLKTIKLKTTNKL